MLRSPRIRKENKKNSRNSRQYETKRIKDWKPSKKENARSC